MKTSECISLLDELFPPGLQEEYDNAGGQIVFGEQSISSVLIALDVDDRVIDEALEKGAGLIVTHHPLLFRPVRKIEYYEPRSRLIIRLIRENLSLYAAHTNLDKVFYDKLAAVLGFTDARVLFREGEEPFGLGSVSVLPEPVKLMTLLDTVKARLSLDQVTYTGDLGQLISRVALVNGAGGSMVEKIISKHPVDCIITGDVGYHQVKYAELSSVAVIDAGHFGTEHILLSFLKEQLLEGMKKNLDGKGIVITISDYEKNPFRHY